MAILEHIVHSTPNRLYANDSGKVLFANRGSCIAGIFRFETINYIHTPSTIPFFLNFLRSAVGIHAAMRTYSVKGALHSPCMR